MRTMVTWPGIDLIFKTHTHTHTHHPDSYDPVTSTEVFYNLPTLPAESIKYDEAKAPQVSDRVRWRPRLILCRWMGMERFGQV